MNHRLKNQIIWLGIAIRSEIAKAYGVLVTGKTWQTEISERVCTHRNQKGQSQTTNLRKSVRCTAPYSSHCRSHSTPSGADRALAWCDHSSLSADRIKEENHNSENQSEGEMHLHTEGGRESL